MTAAEGSGYAVEIAQVISAQSLDPLPYNTTPVYFSRYTTSESTMSSDSIVADLVETEEGLFVLQAARALDQKPKVERPFYFEDSQVVLRANHNISRFPSTLLMPSSNTGRGTEVQNPSLLLN